MSAENVRAPAVGNQTTPALLFGDYLATGSFAINRSE